MNSLKLYFQSRFNRLAAPVLLCGVIIGALCGLGGVVSCSPPEEEKPNKIESFPDQLVARVASVHLKEGYALIQRYGRLKVEDETILYSLGVDGGVSHLKVTGERLGQFIAVDVTSGIPQVGDAIYLRKLDDGNKVDNQPSLNINEAE